MTHANPSGINTEPMATLVVLGILLLVWLLVCYCLKRICLKCGSEPGILIWIPILNIIPMLNAAGLSGWLIILFFIPLVNFITGLVMWAKICQARGKSAWLVIMIFIPILNLLFIPYLAFSE
jgi:hypothetical protein